MLATILYSCLHTLPEYLVTRYRHIIHPSPYVIELIQNKYEQKKLLDQKGIPVPAYKDVEKDEDLAAFGFPVIQKARKGGYDGKGVVLLNK